MNIRRWIIIGTMTVAISVSGGNLREEWSSPATDSTATQTSDAFREALGGPSEEEIQDALIDGGSLASVAEAHGGDATALIELQTSELTALLEWRYSQGEITAEQLQRYKAEARDIITSSAYKHWT